MAEAGVAPAFRERVELARSLLGRVLAGRWTLESVLGIGGTATVYESVHRNGRRAALKVLHPEFAIKPSAVRRFLSEGFVANKVRHSGAVHVLDDGQDGELVFLVMELLEGRSLSERLAREGALPVSDVVRIAVEVLDVLAEAHERGVIHRDLKPGNLFELRTGGIKVLDFGVARVREPGTSAITQSGFTLGTPAFMAPEQAAGRAEEVNAATDIWAVGASMFQLLTARLVHDAETSNAALVAAATKPVQPIRALRPDLPFDVAAAIDRALAYRREDRWPNARAMRTALERALPGAARPEPPASFAPDAAETLPEALPAGNGRSASGWVAAGVAATLLGVAAFLGAASSGGAAPPSEAARAPTPAQPLVIGASDPGRSSSPPRAVDAPPTASPPLVASPPSRSLPKARGLDLRSLPKKSFAAAEPVSALGRSDATELLLDGRPFEREPTHTEEDLLDRRE